MTRSGSLPAGTTTDGLTNNRKDLPQTITEIDVTQVPLHVAHP